MIKFSKNAITKMIAFQSVDMHSIFYSIKHLSLDEICIYQNIPIFREIATLVVRKSTFTHINFD